MSPVHIMDRTQSEGLMMYFTAGPGGTDLETGQLDKPMRQLGILDDLCTFGCKAYPQLERAIDSYRESASNS